MAQRSIDYSQYPSFVFSIEALREAMSLFHGLVAEASKLDPKDAVDDYGFRIEPLAATPEIYKAQVTIGTEGRSYEDLDSFYAAFRDASMSTADLTMLDNRSERRVDIRIGAQSSHAEMWAPKAAEVDRVLDPLVAQFHSWKKEHDAANELVEAERLAREAAAGSFRNRTKRALSRGFRHPLTIAVVAAAVSALITVLITTSGT